MTMNLDVICAGAGHDIASAGVKDKVITDSLAVLQENGVYAFFLYLNSVAEGNKIKAAAVGLLKNREPLKGIIGTETDILKALREKFADKLDALLLAKDLLERMLIYARYHAKAKASDSGPVGASAPTSPAPPEKG